MTVHPDQADPKFKHVRMTCRACVQIPLDSYGIDSIIDTQNLKKPHDMLVNLAALDYERNPNIVTINREGRDIFLECCTEISKEKIV